MSKSEVSVIVCALTDTFIDKFKASIEKSTFKDYELIIMPGPGLPAKKRNDAVKISKGNFLAFFDDDVEIEPSCLSDLLLNLRLDEDCGMTYGKLFKADEPTRLDEAGGFMTWTGFIWSRAGQNIIDEGQYDATEPVLAGKSASCMIKKEVFELVGGFDESFGILGEETDLSWRVWLQGYRVLFVPYARGIHYFNTKFKPVDKHYNSERVQFNGCRNYITMLIKNLGRSHLWIIPVHASLWFGVGLAMLATGKFQQGVNILKGLGYVIGHLGEILEKRKKIQSSRKIDERTLWSFIHSRTPRGYYSERVRRYLAIGLHG